jgi:hypothetical protein
MHRLDGEGRRRARGRRRQFLRWRRYSTASAMAIMISCSASMASRLSFGSKRAAKSRIEVVATV